MTEPSERRTLCERRRNSRQSTEGPSEKVTGSTRSVTRDRYNSDVCSMSTLFTPVSVFRSCGYESGTMSRRRVRVAHGGRIGETRRKGVFQISRPHPTYHLPSPDGTTVKTVGPSVYWSRGCRGLLYWWATVGPDGVTAEMDRGVPLLSEASCGMSDCIQTRR